ncbi:unnamed protein product [Effrenium voratum]|nr:unnamed protein product [Effrenium voratum]
MRHWFLLLTACAAVNEDPGPSQVLVSLGRGDCSRLLLETYGALQGWEPRPGLFRHACLGMAKQLKLGEAAAMNETCGRLAANAVRARRSGKLPSLNQLQELWCRPPDLTMAQRVEPLISALRNATGSSAAALNRWWQQRQELARSAGNGSLLEVSSRALPGSGLALFAADAAQKRHALGRALRGAGRAARRALDFLCDDACGLSEPAKLRVT